MSAPSNLMGLMARLRERYGTTILMITHDVRLVAEWADRALVLSVRASSLFDGAPIDMFGDATLLDDAGLLAPPIYEVSRRLAARGPGSGMRPTLSLARTGRGHDRRACEEAQHEPLDRLPIPGRKLRSFIGSIR